eukprot:m.563489 g.563489  ORF g.563489 m.563489 type:complete len:831 (+) comp22233_c0_seq1:116-2608(+)
MADAPASNPPSDDGVHDADSAPPTSPLSPSSNGRSISISRDDDGSFGIKVSGSRAGIRVKTVSPTSSAAQQKLLRGDILTEIDGIELAGKRSKEVSKMISSSTEGNLDLVVGEPVPRSKSGAHKVLAVFHKAKKGAKKMIRRKMGKSGGTSSGMEGQDETEVQGKVDPENSGGSSQQDPQDLTAGEDTCTKAGGVSQTSTGSGSEVGTQDGGDVVPTVPSQVVVTVEDEGESTTATSTAQDATGCHAVDASAADAQHAPTDAPVTALAEDGTAPSAGDAAETSSGAPAGDGGGAAFSLIDAKKRLSKTIQLDEFERGESCTDYRKTRRKKGDDEGNTSTLSRGGTLDHADHESTTTPPAIGSSSADDTMADQAPANEGAAQHESSRAVEEDSQEETFVESPAKLAAAATMRMVKPTASAATVAAECNGTAATDASTPAADECKTSGGDAGAEDLAGDEAVVVLEDPTKDPLAAPSPGPQPSDTAGVCQDFSMNSQHGTRHGELNQDSCYGTTVRVPSGGGGATGEGDSEIVICAAFDGHGLLGERAAVAAAAELETLCNDQSVLEGFAPGNDTSQAMVDLFARLHDRVCAEHQRIPRNYSYPGRPGSGTTEFKLQKYDQEPTSPDGSGAETRKSGLTYRYSSEHMPPAPIDFGCTAAVAVVVGTQAVVGSLGDAGAVVCRSDSDGEPTGELISATHTAKDDAEIERIERDFPGKAYFTPDGYLAPLDDDLGQYEVQLTRSFGHALLKDFGITAEPHVHTFDVKETNTFALVLCSDGVTDELQPRDIAERVAQEDSPDASAKTLCQDAQDFCMETEKIDDCTAVVLRFKTD